MSKLAHSNQETMDKIERDSASRREPEFYSQAEKDAHDARLYRDIFAEITAKATAIEFDPNDPERIVAYRIPCGPIHRAAGKAGFQMFNGEMHLKNAVARIRELEAALSTRALKR